jgi:hypothetical protein
MGRGLSEKQRIVLEAFEAYPHRLISTEVLLWFVFDEDSDSYGASLRAFRQLPPGADWPWPVSEYDAINLRRSLRNLRDKGLIKCWGRSHYRSNENFWSTPHCEANALRL